MVVRVTSTVQNDIRDNCTTDSFAYGTLKLYTGTQPVTGGGSHSDTLLSTLTFNGFTNGANGITGANVGAMTLPSAVVANGTVGWGRVASGSFVLDLNITDIAGGGDIEMDDRVLTTVDSVNMTDMNFNQPAT